MLISDTQQLRGAKTQYGSDIQTYDDGFGPLWIMRDSMDIMGIVRAQTWEDAYSICEDEFFPEADDTIEELIAEYGHKREHVRRPDGTWDTIETPDADAWYENELFQEAYGFRPNGPNVRDKRGHGIYAKDLNGEYLDALGPALLAQLGIVLDIVSG